MSNEEQSNTTQEPPPRRIDELVADVIEANEQYKLAEQAAAKACLALDTANYLLFRRMQECGTPAIFSTSKGMVLSRDDEMKTITIQKVEVV